MLQGNQVARREEVGQYAKQVVSESITDGLCCPALHVIVPPSCMSGGTPSQMSLEI